MKFKILIFVGFLMTTVGCDMRGDRDLNHDWGGHKPGTSGSGGGSSDGSGDNVLFACDSATCFSGTQFCLKVLGTRVTLPGVCQNFPDDRCRERVCLTRELQSTNSNCRGLIDFEQSQSRITLTCRNAH